MKKVLFTATVDSHILQFHVPYLKYFKEQGYEVHVATNGDKEIPYCDKKHIISFERSPYKINNLKAIRNLRKIIMKERFDIIHTHTPMGSVITRIAAIKARKKYNTRVLYTAHGFHFYKGAPKLNWILFYPIEKILSRYTDTLITINNEDYELAKNKFKCRVEYVAGVGIDEEKFKFKMAKQEKIELRKSLGLKDSDFVMIYPAELNKNKNQIFLIEAMKELVRENKDIHLLLPGKDSCNGNYQRVVNNYKLNNNIHFLGHRTDIPKLLKISDISVSSSLREGLPVNVLEAQITNLPVVVTNCRGNRDLVINGVNGYIIEIDDVDDMVEKIKSIKNNKMTSSLSKEYYFNNVMKDIINTYNVNNKKRILHVLSSNSFSGAENVACQIIDLFEKEYDYLMYYCSPCGRVELALKEKNIAYIPIKKMSINNLKKIVDKNNIDIVHAHDVRSSFISSFLRKNITIISHIHGNHLCMQKITIKSLLYFFCSKRFKHIFWVSDSAYENYIFRNKICTKSSVLINVINKNEVIHKIKLDKNEYSFDIIFLGRLNEAKNPMRMLKILHEVIMKKKDARCAIVGDGELYDDVKCFIAKYNMRENVKIFGYQKNPYKILSSSKIVLMTSVHEGVPMAALEAMSLGIPIVSTPTDGLVKLVDKDNGFLSNLDEEIVSKILEFLQFDEMQLDSINNSTILKFNKINNLQKYKQAIQTIYERNVN